MGKVRYGDYPDRHAQYLSATTIISGITDFSRMDQMRKRVQELNGSTPANHHTVPKSVTEPSNL